MSSCLTTNQFLLDEETVSKAGEVVGKYLAQELSQLDRWIDKQTSLNKVGWQILNVLEKRHCFLDRYIFLQVQTKI